MDLTHLGARMRDGTVQAALLDGGGHTIMQATTESELLALCERSEQQDVVAAVITGGTERPPLLLYRRGAAPIHLLRCAGSLGWEVQPHPGLRDPRGPFVLGVGC